ncbi:MAG: RNA polymerase sigma factor [Myxococcota bacterium]
MSEQRLRLLRGEEDTVSLAGLRALEPRAFEAAFNVFSPRLNGWLLRMGASRAVAAELVQEAFLRLAKHAPTLREDTRVGAWLFTVTRNLWTSHRRWCWLDGTRLLELAEHTFLARPPTPCEAAAAGETAARIERAVAALPEAQRAVFLLVAGEGMEPQEAAEVLGIAADAARQRLARARRTLQEVLA